MSGKVIVLDKSFEFAVRIVKLYKFLCDDKKEFVLSKQLLRAGTSIGANINEAQAGQSKADFIAKMAIASKEARESKYWIDLLIKIKNLALDSKIFVAGGTGLVGSAIIKNLLEKGYTNIISNYRNRQPNNSTFNIQHSTLNTNSVQY